MMMKLQAAPTFFSWGLEWLGASVVQGVSGLGRFSSFMLLVFRWMVRRPFRPKNLLSQMVFIGNKSVFIVGLAGIFSGAVMAYQMYFGFQLVSGDTIVGPIVALAMGKELAPVLTGLIVAGRAGAAMAAQIGSMKVTEQIDALEVMGINSVQYLAVPRVVASFLTLPMLSILFLLVGNIGSWIVGVKILGIDNFVYFSKLGKYVFFSDIIHGLIKAFIFGYIIAIIGTFHGFAVKDGAEGVGRGTNMAVVWGMVLILVTDYFLTSILVQFL